MPKNTRPPMGQAALHPLVRSDGKVMAWRDVAARRRLITRAARKMGAYGVWVDDTHGPKWLLVMSDRPGADGKLTCRVPSYHQQIIFTALERASFTRPQYLQYLEAEKHAYAKPSPARTGSAKRSLARAEQLPEVINDKLDE